MSFANTFPAVSNSEHWADHVVTQGHADYCTEHGHAHHIIDGVLQLRCPRCGTYLAALPSVNAPLADWVTFASLTSDVGQHSEYPAIDGDQLAIDFQGSLPRAFVAGSTGLWEKVS